MLTLDPQTEEDLNKLNRTIDVAMTAAFAALAGIASAIPTGLLMGSPVPITDNVNALAFPVLFAATIALFAAIKVKMHILDVDPPGLRWKAIRHAFLAALPALLIAAWCLLAPAFITSAPETVSTPTTVTVDSDPLVGDGRVRVRMPDDSIRVTSEVPATAVVGDPVTFHEFEGQFYTEPLWKDSSLFPFGDGAAYDSVGYAVKLEG